MRQYSTVLSSSHFYSKLLPIFSVPLYGKIPPRAIYTPVPPVSLNLLQWGFHTYCFIEMPLVQGDHDWIQWLVLSLHLIWYSWSLLSPWSTFFSSYSFIFTFLISYITPGISPWISFVYLPYPLSCQIHLYDNNSQISGLGLSLAHQYHLSTCVLDGNLERGSRVGFLEKVTFKLTPEGKVFLV